MTRGEKTKVLSEMTEKLINPHNDPRIYWAREEKEGNSNE